MSSTKRIKLDDYLAPSIDIDQAIKEALLLCEEKIDKDSICLDIRQGNITHTIATYRNFSCTVGAQKSRKTFFSCMLMAPAVMNNSYEGIKAHTFGRTNIYFDTEQAKYHAQTSNKRISVMSGNNGRTPANFQYYGLRKWSYRDRLEMISYVLRKTPRPGFVVIDGIRDLVSSVNDEQQATEVIESLMRWTDEYDCHINVVIHLKKGDNATPRGWLGTEIQNKAESVIEVRKDFERPREVSEVIPRDFRGIEFEPFKFVIKEGVPTILDIEEIQYVNKLVKEQEIPF